MVARMGPSTVRFRVPVSSSSGSPTTVPCAEALARTVGASQPSTVAVTLACPLASTGAPSSPASSESHVAASASCGAAVPLAR